jgi:hypothetical protein
VKLTCAICIFVFCCLVVPPTSDAEILGPYSGTVFDATSGQPIKGASVLFYWKKKIVLNSEYLSIVDHLLESASVTDLIVAKLAYTSASGKYDLSITYAMTGVNERLNSTHVIIYEPGYQVYIREILRDSQYSKADSDFHNGGNIVRLERIPPDFDHNAHYRQIEDALRGLERPDYSPEKKPGWEGIVRSGLQTLFEKDQLLRRAEWEQKRPGKEGRN